MNEETFLSQRQADWQRLMTLTDRASLMPGRLPSHELHEFVQLYRRVSADLSLVRTQSTNQALTEYLNDLVGRAYVVLYRPQRQPFREALVAGLTAFAETVRRLRYAILASLLVFAAGVAFVPIALSIRPELRPYLIPKDENFEKWKHGDMDVYGLDQALAATAGYSSNNPLVAVVTGAQAAGTFGIGTSQIMFSNGLLLGALATDLAEVGRVGYLILHVSPHGATEITGFILAGGAGFWMAASLISPGRRSRGVALKEAGRDALVMLAGSYVMMLIAAPIEGFVSFNAAFPMALKVLIAVASFAGWMAFFVGYGRTAEASAPALAPG